MNKNLIKFIALSFFLLNASLASAVGKSGETAGERVQAQRVEDVIAEEGNFFFGYVNLVGTVLVSEEDRMLNKAIFTDVFSGKRVTYREGTMLPYGIKLKRVLTDSVVLEKDGERRNISLRDKKNYFADIKALRRFGYQQVADNEWVVNSHYLFVDSKDMIKLAVESGLSLTRLSFNPGIEINNDTGKKMRGLGFQKGDKVVNINGTSLSGISGLTSAYKKMKKSDDITIKILRDGKLIDLKYWVAKRGAPRYNMKQVLASEKIKKMLF